jgi:minor extracellular serine protease Vpr
MRIIILLFLLMNFSIQAQVKISSNSRSDLGIISEEYKLKGGISKELKDRFAIYDIQQYTYVSCIAKVNDQFERGWFTQQNILVGNIINGITSLKIPVQLIAAVDQLTGLSHLELAGKIKPFLDRAVEDTRADSVHSGYGLPQGYTGKDVLIGITDWGFDYSSPMFYDTLMQQTRILAAWDQYKLTGPAPSGYSYGTEYTTPADLILAGSDTSNIYSFHTHGNHVAGIAGGAGAGTALRGMAYEAQFLFTTFLVDEASVFDAWDWMYQYSVQEGKRLVINMSWGLYHIGTLDGNSLLSQAIDGYAALGVVFANSGGNNGDVNFHIKKTFSNDNFTTRINFYPYSSNPNMWGQSIHMWGEQGQSFEAGLKVYDQSSNLAETGFFSTATVTNYIDSFLVLNSDTIWYNISADDVHPINGRPQMRLRIKNTNSALKVMLKSQATAGKVHYWNVTELTNDVGNWGMDFSVYGAGSIAGDNLYGISEPSCSDGVISVAAHLSSYLTGGGTPAGGSRAAFSSIGPRYDEVNKPDISAPGVGVTSSISSYTDASFSTVTSIDFNGRTYPFAKFSGTSMASPCVAGIAALILEANPYLSAAQVKQIIKVTARTDNFTGIIPAGGSTMWGWGKINAYFAVQIAINTVGNEMVDLDIPWNIYPNPSSGKIYFTLITDLPEKAQICDLNGKIIEREIVQGGVDITDLNSGKYYLRLVIDGRVSQQSFIKQ